MVWVVPFPERASIYLRHNWSHDRFAILHLIVLSPPSRHSGPDRAGTESVMLG